MIIGGYTINDLDYGIEVKQYESGWSFFLQGDDVNQFRNEWELAQENNINFRDFLNDSEYSSLFC